MKDENYEEMDASSAEESGEFAAAEQAPVGKQTNWKRETWEWIESILIAVVVALLLRNFVFTLVLVDGDSMRETLHNSDRLVVSRFMYEPKNGDIVVFHPKCAPKDAYVKRVIAVAGQTVSIDYDTDEVLVDGKAIDEPYITQDMLPRGVNDHVTVPEGCVFVMGDNRNNSKDSRSEEVGMVSTDSVLGKAVFRIFPLSDFGKIEE